MDGLVAVDDGEDPVVVGGDDSDVAVGDGASGFQSGLPDVFPAIYGDKYLRAAAKLTKDRDVLLTFCDFSARPVRGFVRPGGVGYVVAQVVPMWREGSAKSHDDWPIELCARRVRPGANRVETDRWCAGESALLSAYRCRKDARCPIRSPESCR